MNLKQREAKSRKLVILWICSFFGVIFMMNAYMITQASTTFNGVVAKKSYQQGIDYNQTLAAKKQIVEEGLYQDLALDLNKQTLNIELVLSHKNKDYKMPENVVLDFWRPTNEGQDFKVSLYAKKGYAAVVDFKDNQLGVWNITYKLSTLDGKQVEFANRVDVR
jgi:nitrogen fixation protein FixH|tara:strand:+ start:595 stop:1086 length:492 start_codon:yes stop_codon:yes gene_type:complete